MTDYTLHLTEKQAAEISHACEILARLRMGQIGMALRELPLDKTMEYEQEQYVSNYLRSLCRPGCSRIDVAAWDLHQVIRHRLAWDRAYSKGIIKPGEPRRWPEMSGVMYDEPMQLASEPLAEVRSGHALELAHHRIHSQACIIADLRAELEEGGVSSEQEAEVSGHGDDSVSIGPYVAYLPETGVRNG